MELYQLKYFMETVHLGSMNKAALKLNVSQPALSVAIRNLESELRTTLFERKGKKVVLTKTGSAILPDVERMLQYEEEIKKVALDSTREINTVRLVVLAGSAIVPEIITRYHSSHPHIDLIVIHKNSTEMEQPDLIINAKIRSNRLKENETVILTEKILVAVPRDHELASRSSITKEELQNDELIGLNRNLSLRNIEEEYCKQEGLSLKHSVECDNPAILRDLISRGIGPALVAEKTWLCQFQPAVKLIPIEGTPWTRDIVIERTYFRKNNELLDQFSEFLMKEYESMCNNFSGRH